MAGPWAEEPPYKLIPWTRELAQFPTPTMAILIFLIAKLLRLKAYLLCINRSKIQVRPLRLRCFMPARSGFACCKRRICMMSRPLARTDIRKKAGAIFDEKEALARR